MGSHRVGHDWSDLAVAVADPNLSDAGTEGGYHLVNVLWVRQNPATRWTWCFVVSGTDQEFCTQVENCGWRSKQLVETEWPRLGLNLGLWLSSSERTNTDHFIKSNMYINLGFPGGSEGKESACDAGVLGSIPGLGRSPGGGHGNPLQYSCLENPHGQRSLVGYSPWGCKESDMIEWLRTALFYIFLLLSDSKASAYNAGDPASIPGWGRSSGEGNGNPLQYPCLENPMGGAW